MLTAEEIKAIQDTVGPQATALIKTELNAYDITMKEFATSVAKQNGGVTKEQFETYKTAAEGAVEAVKDIAAKQGTTLAELNLKIADAGQATKSIAQILEEDKEELKKIFAQGQGNKTYMLNWNQKGQPVMKPFSNVDASKTQGTTSGFSTITQALDAATLLRVGGNAQIYGQFRNTSWVFDLCNTINASFIPGQAFVIWFDEQAKTGGSTAVLEGATKPATNYSYVLRSDTYKKEATIVSFTEEFHMDFSQLESDIMGKARIDVINRLNTAILARIISNATIYNTELSFRGGTGAASYIPLVNDFDAIAAMAAQVDSATFGGFMANAAIMSTFKKYRMGILKDTTGGYLNPPKVLDGISFVGNPAMAADALIVGDLKQYNIILRGGLIVRVGYNGTDFAENKYSTVLEQFYFDYISAIRRPAIVSGPTFQNVKNTLVDDQGSM